MKTNTIARTTTAKIVIPVHLPFVFSVFLRVAVHHIANDTGRTWRTNCPGYSFPAYGRDVQRSTFVCVCRTVPPVSGIASRTLRTPNQRFLSSLLQCVSNRPGICDAPSASRFTFLSLHGLDNIQDKQHDQSPPIPRHTITLSFLPVQILLFRLR